MADWPIVKGTRLRVTKVNNCGLPIAGAASRLVTAGFASASLQPQMRDAEELEQTNAEGKVCVADRTPPTRKYYNAEVELCNVNPGLVSMLTGWPLILDYNGNPIGFADQDEVQSDYGVAFEIWTGGKSDDDCPTPTLDDIFSNPGTGKQYGYFLFCANEFTMGDVEIAAQVSTLTFTGVTFKMPQWGRGPYNVAAIDNSNTAGRLLAPVGNKRHFTAFRTPIAPPDPTPGNEAVVLETNTLFVDPDFYFGGPGNAAPADVAPEQGSATGVVLTITGSPTGGDFKLGHAGHTTATIAYNANAAAVKSALVALDDGYDASDWAVTGASLAAGLSITKPPGTLTVEDNGLTGGTSPTVVITPAA